VKALKLPVFTKDPVSGISPLSPFGPWGPTAPTSNNVVTG